MEKIEALYKEVKKIYDSDLARNKKVLEIRKQVLNFLRQQIEGFSETNLVKKLYGEGNVNTLRTKLRNTLYKKAENKDEFIDFINEILQLLTETSDNQKITQKEQENKVETIEQQETQTQEIEDSKEEETNNQQEEIEIKKETQTNDKRTEKTEEKTEEKTQKQTEDITQDETFAIVDGLLVDGETKLETVEEKETTQEVTDKENIEETKKEEKIEEEMGRQLEEETIKEEEKRKETQETTYKQEFKTIEETQTTQQEIQKTQEQKMIEKETIEKPDTYQQIERTAGETQHIQQRQTKLPKFTFLRKVNPKIVVLGLVGILVIVGIGIYAFIYNKNNNKQQAQVTPQKVVVKENKNVTTTGQNIVVNIESNKEKIKQYVKKIKEQLKVSNGITLEEVTYNGSLFIPVDLGLKYLVSKDNKVKQKAFKIVDEIKQQDEDLKNIRMIILKIKDIQPTDDDLKQVCLENHKNELDCDNIKLLKNNNLIVKEAKVLKEKSLGYFKNLGIIFFVDNNYNFILNDNGNLYTINDFIKTKISKILNSNLLSSKEIGFLEALLDNNNGIINVKMTPILDEKTQNTLLQNLGNVVKKVYGQLNKHPDYKLPFDYLYYYYFLVYYLFNND